MAVSFTTKVVFPAPPPTSNTLTPQQRAHLMRSTKKLGKVLGTTPHLMDIIPSSNSTRKPVEDRETEGYRTSIDSSSSCSSSTNSLKPLTSSLKTTASLRRAMKMRISTEAKSTDSWPSRKPPMLRLSIPAPSLDHAFTPSPCDPNFWCPHRPVNDNDQCMKNPAPNYALTPSPLAPSFSLLPSVNKERRQKMERLRRKLGEEVPLSLVFPSSDSLSSSSSDSVDISTSPEYGKTETRNRNIPPFPSFGFPKSSRAASLPLSSLNRFAKRNCITGRIGRTGRPHAISANEKEPLNPTTTKSTHVQLLIKDKPRVTLKPSIVSKEGRRTEKEKLCAIMESPNEHSAGCAQEFGIGNRLCQGEQSTAYSMADEEFRHQVQLWSTRRGYGGW